MRQDQSSCICDNKLIMIKNRQPKAGQTEQMNYVELIIKEAKVFRWFQ